MADHTGKAVGGLCRPAHPPQLVEQHQTKWRRLYHLTLGSTLLLYVQ